jgi:hypothetical protein
LLELPDSVKRQDGYMMQKADGQADPVSAANLAKILNAGAQKPLLAACNFWNSAAAVAALAVAEGAEAAVGFQDEFDDFGQSETVHHTNYFQQKETAEFTIKKVIKARAP